MSLSDFLKTTMGNAHLLLLGEHVQEGPVLLILVVMLLLMATNVLVISVSHNKRG